MDGAWAEFLTKIIDVSPYLAIMVFLTGAFCIVLKVSINANQRVVSTQIEELRKNQENVLRAFQDAYKK